MIRFITSISILFFSLPLLACGLENAEKIKIDDSLTMSYQLEDSTIVVGQHFSMLFNFCKNGKNVSVNHLALNANMPAHGHGMNYRISVVETASRQYKAEGFLFHMPGSWQVTGRVDYSNKTQTFEIDINI